MRRKNRRLRGGRTEGYEEKEKATRRTGTRMNRSQLERTEDNEKEQKAMRGNR